MNRQELTDIFITRIEEERIKRNLKQNELAKQLDMSVSGYRKMISGNTDSVSLYTAYKASTVLNIPLLSLCVQDERTQLLSKLQLVPDSVLQRVDYYLELEKNLSEANVPGDYNAKYVDLLIPTGQLGDGMTVDAYNIEKILVKDIYAEEINKGIKMNGNSYIPIYAKGDILLINEEMAKDGDIVLLIYAPTRKFYLRKLLKRDGHFECRTICGRGESIIITQESRKLWIDAGHVVATINK